MKTVQVQCPKWKCSVIIKEFPSNQDAEVEKAAIRYFLYYKKGDEIRAGQREFVWGLKSEPKPRGPVVMKTSTLQKKLEERMDADPTLELRLASQRLAARKGIPFATAKAQIMELWGVDENGETLEEEEEDETPDDESEE